MAEPILITGGRVKEQLIDVFVGIDVAKSRNAVAIADNVRGGEVRYFGEVDAAPDAMRRVVQRIIGKHGRAHFCYEAGPTGYGLYRLITGMGYSPHGSAASARVRSDWYAVEFHQQY